MFRCDNEGDERAAAWHAARPHADGGGSCFLFFPLSCNLFVHKEKNRCGALPGSSDESMMKESSLTGVFFTQRCEAHKPEFASNLVPPDLRELHFPAVKNGRHIVQ